MNPEPALQKLDGWIHGLYALLPNMAVAFAVFLLFVLTGFAIAARDGDIGHVEDFVVDGEAWALRYMIVDTVNWWPGRKVLVAPRWIEDISWDSRSVALTRNAVKTSPEYVPGVTLRRDYEDNLYRHYGFAPYWE